MYPGASVLCGGLIFTTYYFYALPPFLSPDTENTCPKHMPKKYHSPKASFTAKFLPSSRLPKKQLSVSLKMVQTPPSVLGTGANDEDRGRQRAQEEDAHARRKRTK